ncbi:hypothetical protein [Flavobacterium sp.]|uniref:hypothetical protein n=1 Tax=Flavobacterium sp. TaxID=239 RepID=UPI00286D71DE|nr:hypothetical protein [Flavobacterium sp.]
MITNEEQYSGEDYYNGKGHFDSQGNIRYLGNKPKENVNDYLAYSFFDISHDGDNGIVVFILNTKVTAVGKPEIFSINFNIEKLVPFPDKGQTPFDTAAEVAFVAIVESKELDLIALEKYYTNLKENIGALTSGLRSIGEGTGIIRRP